MARGFEEHVREGRRVLIIEWADRVEEVLPSSRLNVAFGFCGRSTDAVEAEHGATAEESRRISLSGPRPFWDRLLNDLKFPTSPER